MAATLFVIGLFLFAYLISLFVDIIRKYEIKKEYNNSNYKSSLTLKEYRDKYYNRI